MCRCKIPLCRTRPSLVDKQWNSVPATGQLRKSLAASNIIYKRIGRTIANHAVAIFWNIAAKKLNGKI